MSPIKGFMVRKETAFHINDGFDLSLQIVAD